MTMAIMRVKEIRELAPDLLDKRIEELSVELNSERGTVASGGKASNAGRIREIRRTIARIITIKKEKEKEAKTVSKVDAKKNDTG